MPGGAWRWWQCLLYGLASGVLVSLAMRWLGWR